MFEAVQKCFRCFRVLRPGSDICLFCDKNEAALTCQKCKMKILNPTANNLKYSLCDSCIKYINNQICRSCGDKLPYFEQSELCVSCGILQEKQRGFEQNIRATEQAACKAKEAEYLKVFIEKTSQLTDNKVTLL